MIATKLRLSTFALPGLSPDSLGNYLASLGILRVLSRKWPATRIAWREDVLHVMGGPNTLEELLDELVRVASTQAEAEVSKREWTQYDKAWSDEQKKGTKAKSGEPLALWQASAQESYLELFAAHAVPHTRVSFNPLLGSGGNAGRRDFSSGWRKAVNVIAAEPKVGKGSAKKAASTAGSSSAIDPRKSELRALLLGQQLTWLVEKLAAGSWFSDATKLYNSGQSPAREGTISPWAMALACEGLVFFAGGASRRLGSRAARAVGAFPFITQPIAASAEKEADRLRGEIWTPLWSRPMSLGEARTLFARGRAELNGRGALTPAAFATAIHERGVDAGVSEFRRYTLGRTTSSNTFEPRLESRFPRESDASPATSLTLKRVTALIEHRGFPRDGKRFVGLRGPIESAILDVASNPHRSEAAISMVDAVSSALDRIDRNRSFREGKIQWEPLPLEWLPALFADEQPSVEARLALSLVSAFPVSFPFTAFRFGVEWARDRNGKYDYDWTTKPAWFEHSKVAPARWVWAPGDLARVIGAVLSRKLIEESRLGDAEVASTLGRAPLPAKTSFIRRWLVGDIDERLLASWLSRLALFDWRRVPSDVRALIRGELESSSVDGDVAMLGLMQPLIDRLPLFIKSVSPNDLLSNETGARTTEVARSLVTLIRGGNTAAGLRLASSRYAMAGARLASVDIPWQSQNPDRLIAALLFTITNRERAELFQRWLRPQRR